MHACWFVVAAAFRYRGRYRGIEDRPLALLYCIYISSAGIFGAAPPTVVIGTRSLIPESESF